MKLGGEKSSDILADLARDLVRLVESADFVIKVSLHHAGYLGRVDHDRLRADAVGRMVDGNVRPGRRVVRLVDIVEPAQRRGMTVIEF